MKSVHVCVFGSWNGAAFTPRSLTSLCFKTWNPAEQNFNFLAPCSRKGRIFEDGLEKEEMNHSVHFYFVKALKSKKSTLRKPDPPVHQQHKNVFQIFSWLVFTLTTRTFWVR